MFSPFTLFPLMEVFHIHSVLGSHLKMFLPDPAKYFTTTDFIIPNIQNFLLSHSSSSIICLPWLKHKILSQALVVPAYNLSYWEAKIRRISIWGQPREIVWETPLQNNKSKMDWRCGSSGRALALQAQNRVQMPVPQNKKQKLKILRTRIIHACVIYQCILCT
jgi:hypothetical protein